MFVLVRLTRAQWEEMWGLLDSYHELTIEQWEDFQIGYHGHFRQRGEATVFVEVFFVFLA
jgi:hypothetical protein